MLIGGSFAASTLLGFQMFQVQQRIAVLTKSRAKLLAELHELDRLREQVRKAERLRACAGEFQEPPSGGSTYQLRLRQDR
jgi:Tfp pilus assembly protein PilN